MNITRDNYEAYLVDYSNGDLSESISAKVEAFLLTNPDIQIKLEHFKELNLPVKVKTYTGKTDLKNIPQTHTTDDSRCFNELCVGHIEKTNSAEEEVLLEQLVKNDSNKQHTFNQYKKTIITPEPVVFKDKYLLKKSIKSNITNNISFENECIADSESFQNIEEQQKLQNLIKLNPKKKKTHSLYKATKLKADSTLAYKNKSKLKKYFFIKEKHKKAIAYFSAIAAIAIFSFLIFNTYKLENHNPTITTNAPKQETKTIFSEVDNKESNITPLENKLKNKDATSNLIKKSPIVIQSTRPYRKQLTPIEAIGIFKLECPKCIAYNQTLNNTKHTLSDKLGSQFYDNALHVGNDELGWKLAQASIFGINKITNADMALSKQETKEKKQIVFSSKFISISTPVKRK